MIKNILKIGIVLFVILSLRIPLVSASAQATDSCDSGPYTATIGFSSDGQYVYSGWSTGDQHPSFSYVVWQTNSGKVARSYTAKYPSAAAFSPDGKYFAIGDFGSSSIKIVGFSTGKEIFNVETQYETEQLRFLHDDKWLLSIQVGETNLWDIATGKLIHSFLTETPERGASETLSPDEKYFFAVGGDNIDIPLSLWDVTTGTPIKSFDGFSGAFSPDSKLLAIEEGKDILIWNMASQSGRTIKYPDDPAGDGRDRMIRSFSPDGRYLVVSVDVWENSTIAGEQSSDGSVLYSGIEVWDVQTGKRIWNFGKQGTSAYFGIFSDAEHIVIISTDGFELWNLETQQRDRRFLIADQWQVQPSGVFATSPDGNYMLSRIEVNSGNAKDGFDRTPISLWDIKTGKIIMDYCVTQ